MPAVARVRDGSNCSPPTFDLDFGSGLAGSRSIGRLRGFHGNYGCFVRSYAYICSLGGDGLRDASETAVLNANYLLARLREQRRSPSTCRSHTASCACTSSCCPAAR